MVKSHREALSFQVRRVASLKLNASKAPSGVEIGGNPNGKEHRRFLPPNRREETQSKKAGTYKG